MDKVLHTGSRIALILTWMTFFFIYTDLPEISPTHFNLHGEADGFGHKKIFFILPIICSLTFGLLWYLEDKPYLYNYPVKITPENAKTIRNGIKINEIYKCYLALDVYIYPCCRVRFSTWQ